MEQVQKQRWCGLQELLWVRETLQGMFSLLLCPVATRTLRYCPCCAIHVCDRCCSFPAGTILLLKAVFLISISYKGIFFSSDKQLSNSPINVGVPETQQSADTVLGWRGSLALAVSAVSLRLLTGSSHTALPKLTIRL